MRVNGTRPTNTAAQSGRSRAANGAGGFSVGDKTSPARTESLRPSAALAGLDAILSVQSVNDPLTGRRRALRRGENMLDALDDIRVGLLSGSISAEQVRALKALTSRQEASGDADLDALIEEIDLRAQVELAKLEARGG